MQQARRASKPAAIPIHPSGVMTTSSSLVVSAVELVAEEDEVAEDDEVSEEDVVAEEEKVNVVAEEDVWAPVELSTLVPMPLVLLSLEVVIVTVVDWLVDEGPVVVREAPDVPLVLASVEPDDELVETTDELALLEVLETEVVARELSTPVVVIESAVVPELLESPNPVVEPVSLVASVVEATSVVLPLSVVLLLPVVPPDSVLPELPVVSNRPVVPEVPAPLVEPEVLCKPVETVELLATS